MAGLPAISAAESVRTRRWDAVVLGGALPGLIAAILLGRRGLRVLVLEEEASVGRFPGLREPFLMTGAGQKEVLGACLRALSVPLIDQRRLEAQPVAYQVVLPDARVEVGDAERAAEELGAWGLLEPDRAQALVHALARAGERELAELMAAPLVRASRRRSRGGRRAAAARAGAPAEGARGLPEEMRDLPDVLATVFGAQIRTLSNLGGSEPPPEARARLLGSALAGGSAFSQGVPWLRALLRRRVESLYGEFRAVKGRFRLVSASNQPGVALDDSGEVWVGRALVLNAPREALAAAADQDPIPDCLRGPRADRRRVSLHFRMRRDRLPEGMPPRLILVGDPHAAPEGTNAVALQTFPDPTDAGAVDLVARAVVDVGETGLAEREAEVERGVAALLPFAEGNLRRERTPEPTWDTDSLLADPDPASAWPQELELRLSARPPTYVLERACVAALGFEGDVLLGWRAGDALAAELG